MLRRLFITTIVHLLSNDTVFWLTICFSCRMSLHDDITLYHVCLCTSVYPTGAEPTSKAHQAMDKNGSESTTAGCHSRSTGSGKGASGMPWKPDPAKAAGTVQG